MLPRTRWRARRPSVLAGGGRLRDRPRPRRPARGPGRGRPERPAGGHHRRAGQRRPGRAAAAGRRGAGRPPGPPGRGRRRPAGARRRPGRPPGRPRPRSPTSRTSWPGTRQVVAEYASAVYRDGGALTPLTLLLSGGDPGEIVAAMGYLEAVDAHAAEVVAAAEQQRRAAVAERDRAAAALAQAQARADQVAAEVQAAGGRRGRGDRRAGRRARGRRPAARRSCSSEQVRVNDGDRRQLAGLPGRARGGGRRAAAGRAAAGPGRRGCRAGCAPVGSVAGGRAARRRAAAPAADVAARAAPRGAHGRHDGDGPARPALRAGDRGAGVLRLRVAGAVGLPCRRGGAARPTRPACSPTTRPIATEDVLPGDLVFLGTPEAGLGHVGMALDSRSMLAADARAGAVVVRSLPMDQVLMIGRPSLGQRPAEPAPGPTGGALRVECGNTVYPPSFDGARSWGGYPNGLIPPSALCGIGAAAHALRCDAAACLPRDGRRLRRRVRDADLHHRLLPDLRRPGPAVRAEAARWRRCPAPATTAGGWRSTSAGASTSYGTPQYRWMVGQRRPLRLAAPDVGRPRQRSRGALALGVRRDLTGTVGGRA